MTAFAIVVFFALGVLAGYVWRTYLNKKNIYEYMKARMQNEAQVTDEEFAFLVKFYSSIDWSE